MLNIKISIKIAEVSQEILLKRNKDHHLMFFQWEEFVYYGLSVMTRGKARDK